jgi:hypothetical protein
MSQVSCGGSPNTIAGLHSSRAEDLVSPDPGSVQPAQSPLPKADLSAAHLAITRKITPRLEGDEDFSQKAYGFTFFEPRFGANG